MKYVIIVAAIATAALSCSRTTATAEDLSLLFVQTSEGMTANSAQFRMKAVSNQTIYFSDRPNRLAGHIRLDKFVGGWTEGDDSFAQNPPNAVLSVYSSTGMENSLVVVELLAPQMEGSDLVYTYQIVEGEMPKSGGATSLFIDTFGPGGGVGAGFHGVGVGRRGPGVAGWAGVAVRNCESGNC